MKKENTTKYAVLGVLSIMPCSGYDIKKISDMSISHFWSENYGHIYPVLKMLEADGMVTSEPQQAKGRPPKSIFRITEKGSRALNEWLLKPVEYHPYRNELLLKIFLARDVPPENVKEKLLRDREGNEKKLATLQGIEEMLKGSEPYRSQKSLPLWLMTIDLGKRISLAQIEWCDHSLRALDALPGATGITERSL
ncbi:MAG TPA: PadR family transcriptional regulator [Spirochaetia bacterium]|nr:PadR family transcriptional regulator [Spirochaetia bacterium]